MKIEIRRYSSKPNMLVCTRQDGSTAFQSYGNQSNFFPVHDLTHYAAETILSYSDAFFGMIANGRNFTESESNISTQGHWAEHLVGILMLDGLGLDPSLDQILSTIDPALAKGGFPRLDLSEDQLEMIRRRRTELVSEWQALPNDHVMRLDFPG